METKIYCIGEILWDKLPKGLYLGGAPYNVACHLNMLQENVAIISRVGQDDLGEDALRQTSQNQMTCDHIQLDDKYSTGLVDVILEQADQPRYEIKEPAAWDFIELNDRLLDIVSTSRAFIYGSLAQRNETSRCTIERLRAVSSQNVFDVNLRPPYDDLHIVEQSLKDAHIVKLNDEELMKIAIWFKLSNEQKKAVTQLADRFECRTVCVTRGAAGAVLWHRDAWTEHEGFKVKIKDTVGSGDAFLAALLKGILSDQENEEVLTFANAVGAFVAEQDGATPALDMDKIHSIKNIKE